MSKYLHKSPLSHICTNHSLRYIHSVTISRCTSNSDLAITWFGAMPPSIRSSQHPRLVFLSVWLTFPALLIYVCCVNYISFSLTLSHQDVEGFFRFTELIFNKAKDGAGLWNCRHGRKHCRGSNYGRVWIGAQVKRSINNETSDTLCNDRAISPVKSALNYAYAVSLPFTRGN